MDDRHLFDHARGLCYDTAIAIFDASRRIKQLILRVRLKRLEHELRAVARELERYRDAHSSSDS